MPLRSKAELRYLMATKPHVGQEFVSKTANVAALPERAPKKPKRRRPIP